MQNLTRLIAVTALLPLLAGCGDTLARINPFGQQASAPRAAPVTTNPLARPPAGSQSAAALDTTTEAERVAALAAPATGDAPLGRVVVSLGAVAEPGFWLRSPLVTAPGKGRVVTAAGKSVAVDLLPGTGAAQLSLAAYRALELGLTDLVEVSVFSG